MTQPLKHGIPYCLQVLSDRNFISKQIPIEEANNVGSQHFSAKNPLIKSRDVNIKFSDMTVVFFVFLLFVL